MRINTRCPWDDAIRLTDRQVKIMTSFGLALRISLFFAMLLPATAAAQVVTKAQVGDLIRKVEDGVDEFEKYLEQRGKNARAAASTAPAEGGTARRRRNTSAATTEARRAHAQPAGDELEEKLDDLDGSTNRLRLRFRRVQDYMQTKAQVERVVDDGREINQLMVRGSYRGSSRSGMRSPADSWLPRLRPFPVPWRVPLRNRA